MMASRISQALAIAAAIATVAGCSATPPAHFYALSPMAAAADAPPTHYSVLVGPVSVPAVVDRPQFVVQVAPNRVELADFNRWASPLEDGIAHAVAGNLAVLLGTPDVATAPLANFTPAFRVMIDVQRFESVPDEAAVIDAFWTVHASAGGKTRSGRSVARESVQGKGYEALAAAHSRALARVSADIAAAIREAAATAKP